MNKKGISMIIFVIAIVMVLVLVTAVTTSYTTIINSTKIREYGNELNSLQKAVDEYELLNGEYPVKQEYSLNLDLINTTSKETQFGKSSGIMEFYIIDLEKLGVTKLNRGIPINIDTMDAYAISKDNGKVYYLAGVEIDENWYYTLVDEIKEKLDI